MFRLHPDGVSVLQTIPGFVKPSRRDIPLIVLAAVFASFVLAGYAVVVLGFTGALFSDFLCGLLTVTSFISLALFFYLLLKLLFHWLARRGSFLEERPIISSGALAASDYGHPILFRWLPLWLLIAWIPYVIAFAPGSVNADTDWMIAQFEGLSRPSTHHPLFASGAYGVLFLVGKTAGGGDSAGAFAMVVAQTLCLVAAVTFEVRVIRHFNVRFGFVIASVAFFAICPIFGAYCVRVVKDSLFASAFIVFVCLVALYCESPRKFGASPFWMSLLVLFSVLVGLLRNNGIIVVFVTLPLLLLRRKPRSLAELFCQVTPIILVLALVPGLNLALALGLHASYGKVAEALSVPFQQTARYLVYHGDDVEPWEREAISAVLDFDALPEVYSPWTSDPVKKTFKKDGLLSDYFKAYVSMGVRHPFTYFDATAVNTYGYWLPLSGTVVNGQMLGIEQAQLSASQYGHGWSAWSPDGGRGLLDYVDAFRSIPLLNMLMCVASYAWVLFACVAFLLTRKRRWGVLVLLPCVVLLLTCVASPINGSVRYALGMIASMPVCIVVSLHFLALEE